MGDDLENPATTFTANNHNATKAFDPGIELSTSVVRPASDEMGCANSKSDDPDEEEQPSNNPANIHYDNDGNLRHGGNVHDRDDELHKILASDDAIEEEGKLWYIIDSAWSDSWLEFVSLGKDISPAPGPIKNMTLLVTNYDARCFEARPELVMAKHGNQGDYRKISKEMWDHFCDFYPGSGPEIKMYFKEDADHFNDCKYDTSGWIINQSSYTEYILENPHPKKKAYDNEDLPQMLSGGAVTAASASAGNTEGEMPQQLSAGRMEDNRVTDEQRHNLSIFLGGGKIEDTVRTSTVADGYANVVRKPDRSAKKLTSDMWLFGSAPQ